MNNNGIDITSIITSCKDNFTRDKKSVIKDFLYNNDNSVVVSLLRKTRGDSMKIYTLDNNNNIKAYDYVLKNAYIVLQALHKNGVKLYKYDKSANNISEYTLNNNNDRQ